MNGRLSQLVDVSSPQVLLAEHLRQYMLELQRAEKNLILAATDAEMDMYARQMETTERAISKDVEALKKLASEAGKAQIAAFEVAFANFQQISYQVREARRKNTNQQAFALSTGAGRELYYQAEGALRKLTQTNDNEAATLRKRADEAARQVALGARTV
jgi:methyl-accepting chemotaxis protein